VKLGLLEQLDPQELQEILEHLEKLDPQEIQERLV